MSKAKALALLAASLGVGGVGGGVLKGALDNSQGAVPPDESQTNPENPAGSDANTGNEGFSLPPVEIKLTPDVIGTTKIEKPDAPELRTNEVDPGVEALLQLVGKSMDPRYQAIVGDQNLRRQKELNEQTQQLALEKQMQMDKRLIEQENIRAWRDTYKAQVEANAKLALGTASTIALAMTPNSNFQAQITNAMNSAMGAGKTVA